MDKERLLALADQCEKAELASRELDRRISLATLPPIMPGSVPSWPEGMPPQFTASLDAAMKLVPEGWAIDRLAMWPGGGPLSCYVNLLGTFEREGERWHNYKCGKACGHACAPALALCAAALRATAAVEAAR